MKYLQLVGQFDVKPSDPSYLKLQLIAKVFHDRGLIRIKRFSFKKRFKKLYVEFFFSFSKRLRSIHRYALKIQYKTVYYR